MQDLEQMGKEQDKESDKLDLLNKVEGHRRQMLRSFHYFTFTILQCNTHVILYLNGMEVHALHLK